MMIPDLMQMSAPPQTDESTMIIHKSRFGKRPYAALFKLGAMFFGGAFMISVGDFFPPARYLYWILVVGLCITSIFSDQRNVNSQFLVAALIQMMMLLLILWLFTALILAI